MTKADLSYRALKKLYPKLTQDSKTSMKEMIAAIGNARDSIISEMAWANWSRDMMEDMVWEGVITTHEALSPTKNKRTNRWYVQLPFKPLVLPKNMGIYQITPCNNNFEYYQVPMTFNSLFSDSPAKNLEGDSGYWLNGDIVEFTTPQKDDTKLDFHVVESSEGIGDDDYFPFPADKEEMIIERATNAFILQKDIPEDLSDNNLSDS